MIYRNADLSELQKMDEFLIYPAFVKVPHPTKVHLFKLADSVITTNYIALSNINVVYDDGTVGNADTIEPTKEACFSALIDEFLSLFKKKGLKKIIYDKYF